MSQWKEGAKYVILVLFENINSYYFPKSHFFFQTNQRSLTVSAIIYSGTKIPILATRGALLLFRDVAQH